MVLSRLLEICERESVKKSECGLSCWLFLPAARKRRERMCALSCWQICPAWKACVEERERMLPRLFIVPRESDPGRMAWNILISRKYEFGTKTVKIFLRQTIIWNSFCYIQQCYFPKVNLLVKSNMIAINLLLNSPSLHFLTSEYYVWLINFVRLRVYRIL